MGRLAEALRANLKSVAASDARALREIDQELRAATSGVVPSEAQLTGQVDAKALLGKGSFKQHFFRRKLGRKTANINCPVLTTRGG